MKNFDFWLQRLSHIAQFGLFIITLFTIYYTVIPLYQMAALQEGIARKESELAELNFKVKEAHYKIRAYVIDKVVAGMILECSGLLVPPVAPLKFREEAKADKVPFIFESDSASCLSKEFEEGIRFRGTELSKSEVQFFRERLGDVLVELEAEKALAVKAFNDYRGKVVSGEITLSESTVDVGLMDALNIPLSQRDAILYEERIRAGKSDIVWKYVDFFGKKLTSLKTVDWIE